MAPSTSYLVCATPRSGSTLLCKLLGATGVAGHPEEYFEALRHSGLPRRPHEYFDPDRHANIIRRLAFREMPDSPATPNDLWAPDTYDRYLEWALAEGSTPNGVFGAKLMWGYLGDFAQLVRGIDGHAGLALPSLLDRVFPGLRYVRITRRDKVRQAVSLWRAVQTQAWRQERNGDGPRKPAGEPQFSFRAINYLVRELTAHDASWDAYFLGLGTEPPTITYEDLAEAHEPVIRRVLDHLGVPVPDDLEFGEPELRSQSDDLSERWVERFNEQLERLEGPEPA